MEFVALELATETGEHLMMSIVLLLTVALVPRRLFVFLPELKSPPGYAHFLSGRFCQTKWCGNGHYAYSSEHLIDDRPL